MRTKHFKCLLEQQLKIIGYLLIIMACYEMVQIVLGDTSGKVKFWPLGAELGAALVIWLVYF